MAPLFSRVGFNKGFARRFVNKANPFSATGGTKTTSGIYTIHTFQVQNANPFGEPGTTYNTTFTWSGEPVPAGFASADILIVAGGGSGGNAYPPRSETPDGGHYGGGGGAGGYTYIPGINLIPYGNTINVQVGRGGKGYGYGGPENGDNSSFGPIISYGGGYGGNRGQGNSGGSGGGWGTYWQGGATNIDSGGSATRGNHPLSQGNPGGGARNEGISNTGGGGGGAGSQGSFGQNYPNPPGGTSAGLSNSISGSPITYCTGGPSGSNRTYDLHTGNGGSAGTTGQGGGTPFGNAGSPGIVVVRYIS